MPLPLIVFFIGFLLLSLLKVPIAFSMLLSSFAFLYLTDTPLYIFPERISSGLYSFPLLAMPFFILAARIMNSTGITRRIFDFCLALVGHKKAGLAYVNVVASMIFAGISGSAMADVAGLGSIEMKAMIDNDYDPGYSAAITAASCTIGPVVPPSMIMILVGVMMEESVGKLFAGGFIPGIIMGLSIIVFIYVQSWRGRITIPSPKKVMIADTRKELHRTLKEGFLALLAPVIILGAILSGVCTPTEAGVIAVLYALFLGIIYRELTFKNLFTVLKEGAFQTGVIMFIVSAAQIFAWIITTERVAVRAYTFILQFVSSEWAILLIINLVLLLIGCFIEGLAAILITIPVLLPVINNLGIDPIHFGVFLTINILIGLITPPIGIAVYISSDLAKVPVMEVFKKSIPFLIPLLITLLLVTYIPELSLFLPRLLFP